MLQHLQPSLRCLACAVAAVSLPMLLGCDGDESIKASKVDPDSIWADFRGTWDESSDQIGLAVQFRLKGPNGRPIRLDGASRVTLPASGTALLEQKGGAFGFDGMTYSASFSEKRAALAPLSDAANASEALGRAAAEAGDDPKLVERTYGVLWVRSDAAERTAEITVSQAPRLDAAAIPASVKRTAGFAARFLTDDETGRQAFLSEEVQCVLVSLARSEGAVPPPAPEGRAPDPNTPVVTTPEPAVTPSPAAQVLTELRYTTSRSRGCLFDAAALRSFAAGPAEVKVVARQERPAPAAFGRRARVVSETTSQGTWLTVTD